MVVQPHRRLVTNQGKGYHIRCRYQTQAKTISNHYNTSGSIGTTPVVAAAAMPTCNMKILMTDSGKEMVAESVKIGDKLTLTIAIDSQPVYGMKVTNCLVRDGLNWGEQPLLNDEGCPIDNEIMGPFTYSHNRTKATVSFQAHKFPYTSSVYYQCNVRLCLKETGGCYDVPPDCDKNGIGYRRRRREIELLDDSSLLAAVRQEDSAKDLSVEVYSGLRVNEVEDEEIDSSVKGQSESRSAPSHAPLSLVRQFFILTKAFLLRAAAPSDSAAGQKVLANVLTCVLLSLSTGQQAKRVGSAEEFCISMRKFAIGVAIASLLLMLAVVFLVACILQRRRRRKGSSSASSIYSGPYSNRGYSRD